jgi:YegS/Rv2252/BmrU family lipid kinase
MKSLLVFNKNAGSGRAAKLLEPLKSKMNSLGIQYDVVVPQHQGHAAEIVAQKDLSPYDSILAAGGDGTLFESLNGLLKNKAKKDIPLGVIPVGTGNAFARDIDLHVDSWESAIDLIGQGKTRRVDVGHYSTKGDEHYFLNILGLGFVADVGATAKKLKVFGNLSYTLGVVYQTLFLNPTQMSITVDGKKIDSKALFVEVSNSKYTANFLMAPNAELDDGYLDITIARPMGRIKLLRSFPKILTGDHIHMDEIDHFRAKEIHIEAVKEKLLTPDGELMGSSPVSIHCQQKKVKMFWK